MSQTITDFTVTSINGTPTPLSQYKGKVLLIVNVASRCGLTYQYEGLEKLYKKYKDKGFEVLGFPCNQFARQEPGSESEIQSFCKTNYDVTFPLFKKIDVNGPKADPLYQFLKNEKKAFLFVSAITWNFTKFLIDRNGNVVERISPKVKPETLESRIEALL